MVLLHAVTQGDLLPRVDRPFLVYGQPVVRLLVALPRVLQSKIIIVDDVFFTGRTSLFILGVTDRERGSRRSSIERCLRRLVLDHPEGNHFGLVPLVPVTGVPHVDQNNSAVVILVTDHSSNSLVDCHLRLVVVVELPRVVDPLAVSLLQVHFCGVDVCVRDAHYDDCSARMMLEINSFTELKILELCRSIRSHDDQVRIQLRYLQAGHACAAANKANQILKPFLRDLLPPELVKATATASRRLPYSDAEEISPPLYDIHIEAEAAHEADPL